MCVRTQEGDPDKLILWQKKDLLAARCTNCRRICGKLLNLRPRCMLSGRILRLSHATSGSAGLRPARKRRLGVSASGRHFRKCRAECAGRAAGLVAVTVKKSLTSVSNFREKGELLFHPLQSPPLHISGTKSHISPSR